VAGNKGFRNLPKLERLKRGRPMTTRPLRASASRPLPARSSGPLSVALAAFPPFHQHLIRRLADLLGPSAEAFLVGGALRDLFLSRPAIDDLDFALPGGALETARSLADQLGGHYVCLDAERGAARVILTTEEGHAQIDLTDFRAPTIEADLRGRDFTVNALAVSASRLAETGKAPVLDPTGGLADLGKRRLRLAGPSAFADDPVRALRGVRLASLLGLRLDAQGRRAARGVGSRLGAAAPERIREELVRILGLPRAAADLSELDRLGLLPVLLPESVPMKSASQPLPHRFSVWEHSLRAVEAVDELLADLTPLAPYDAGLAEHLEEPLGDGLTRREVLKLAALLHDVAKPRCREVVDGRIRFIGHDTVGAEMAQAIARRFRLASAATEVLVRLVRHHLRLMHLGHVPEISRRARYRFFRDLGAAARDLLLLTLADAASVRGVSPIDVWRSPAGLLVADFFRGWEEDAKQSAVPPLLRGGDVMSAFGLAPGPEVGRLLALAREAQDLGVVATREEALAYLREARLTARLP
jgi:putative nucleotidyltransferase with HDIG domain